MKTIEVKSCGECPFSIESIFNFCNLDTQVDVWPPKDKVHKKCPLKKEPVTVKVKEHEDQ